MSKCPMTISTNPVLFRFCSIMENYFCFCEGEDDHAASPHVQGVSPMGPISQKKAPSVLFHEHVVVTRYRVPHKNSK